MIINDEKNGGLIVGDLNSILIFGSETQSELQEYSRTMASVLCHDNGFLVDLIASLNHSISNSQGNIFNRGNLLDRILGRNPVKRRYKYYLNEIDRLSLELKLQEAKLLKDNAIFATLRERLSNTIDDLESCIATATKILEKFHTDQMRQVDHSDTDDIGDWYSYLKKRIEALCISQIVSRQCMTQMVLIINNNMKLIQRIQDAISISIPIWINQISILLGIDRQLKSSEVQIKLRKIHEEYGIDTGVQAQRKNAEPLNLQSINESDKKLLSLLSELWELEMNSEQIRKALIDATSE